MAHKTTIATKEKNERLYRAILALETEEECYAFFQDLCTIAELRSMEQRYEVATLLSEGMVYSDILERTGASSATISRVNRALKMYARQYGVEFLYRDFRSNFRAGNQRARELGFYMQKYCGCVFSEADRYQKQIDRDRAKFDAEEAARQG